MSTLVVIAAAPTAASTRSPAPAPAVASSAYSRPFLSIEQYYLSLVNCTRTGGWVLKDGTCRGYGTGRYSRYVAPLRYSTQISDRVARPYSLLLATQGVCSHFLDHDPGYRLRRGGFTSWSWGENVGCGDGYATAKASVLSSHLRMQAEKYTNGGHWRNFKNARFRYLGVGIWRVGNRTRLVTDFYG